MCRLPDSIRIRGTTHEFSNRKFPDKLSFTQAWALTHILVWTYGDVFSFTIFCYALVLLKC